MQSVCTGPRQADLPELRRLQAALPLPCSPPSSPLCLAAVDAALVTICLTPSPGPLLFPCVRK